MKFEKEFIIPADENHTGIYPQVHVDVDEDGDLSIRDDEGCLLLSYAQAHALLMKAGQVLIEYDRSFGFKPNPPKAISND